MKSWFSLVKRLFIWDTNSTSEKKDRRRKWMTLPSSKEPPPSKETRICEAEDEHSKQALTVAIASAAEAAITAAHVAVEVVRLNYAHQCREKQEEFQDVKTKHGAAAQPTYQWETEECSAIKIQTAFRGYLARKALRALKGIVKLQAIIRGRSVRRQAMSTLKCLQSIVSIQSQVCARRLQMVEGKCECDENEGMEGSKDKIIRMDSNKEKRWDDSILLKEELDASCIIKKGAVLKRERIKEYSFNHRRSAESERKKVNGRWRYWLEQWVDTQLSKSKELEDLDTIFSSHSRDNIQRHNQVEALDSPIVAPKKSFPYTKLSSEGEDHSFPNSPKIPTYMASTKSAQAKVRSTSSPRVRTGMHLDMNSDSNSPCKKKLSIVTSISTEVLSNNGKIVKLSSTQQRSPSLKGISRPIKSSQTMKDLSINSECSMLNWDQ
ncbi:PREDICTED: protein IQ-DOMAIN 14-like isoform X2 [Lupinus angustifolius]|uniref:protein IQ-DOMAIN 14-like isoform X2 n=1 Tax=Lupinus angustifolius TaxID=3871 RepID=UPI00092F291B|nr:PREDICTED: protein IQ-DOMAIN 14-like isoform X2 [Lupinus angustifolius]